MKWNKRAKQTATATSALLLAILLTACANNNTIQNPIQTEQVDQQDQVDSDVQNEEQNEEQNDADNDTDNDTEQSDPDDSEKNNNESTNNDDVDAIQSVEGSYIGAIDSHSIEVEIDGSFVVFQIDESFQHVIHEYKENSKVKIEYKEVKIDDSDYTQNWITSIEIVS